MAYTSIIPVHRLDNSTRYVLNREKTALHKEAVTLEDAVGYALDRRKTEQTLFESALGCTCGTAFADMCRVKEQWHKTGGVQGFHLVQSFAAGEVSPQTAHEIGVELARRLLKGEYQVIIGTHLNTGHIHNHLVWNSVSLTTGKKYRSNAKSYVGFVRKISDELCAEHGLSVIQTDRAQQVSRTYAQWLAEQTGRPTWKSAIQQDIDSAVAVALTWRQFLRLLEQRGYTLRLDRKYITLQPPGKARPVRFKTLGQRYTPEAIRQRILQPKTLLPMGKAYGQRSMRLRSHGKPLRKLTGLYALYYTYLYRMGVLPRKPKYPGYAVRQDIRRLDRRIEQMQFVFKHRIHDRAQLTEMRMDAEREIAALLKERQRLYRTRRNSPQIGALTEKLRPLRRTIRLCRDIEKQSLEMEQRMKAARQEEREQSVQHKKKTIKERGLNRL